MQTRPLAVLGAHEFTPRVFTDPRGAFLEWFTSRSLREAADADLPLQQANCSVSATGALRGVHFAQIPPGQAKYVTCARGAVFDVVVDVRTGSPTFGRWDAVVLDDEHRRCVYLAEGLGHAFLALEEGSTVVYLSSAPYTPDREFGIDPFDRALGITWPDRARDGAPLTPVLSDKDAAAPTLAEAARAGLLPTWRQANQRARPSPSTGARAEAP